MTRNEMLDELSVLHERFKNGMGWRDGNYEEALDKAIEILEQAEQTEPQISPSDCATCKHDLWSTPRTCSKCVGQEDGKPSMYEPKDEPQTASD